MYVTTGICVSHYKSNNQMSIQSVDFLAGRIPVFLLKTFENLTSQYYHACRYTSFFFLKEKSYNISARESLKVLQIWKIVNVSEAYGEMK